MLITDEYKKLQAHMHEQCPEYGVSGQRHIDFVRHLSEQIGSRDILDYGCGKCTLQKGLPFPIQNYDPCIAEHIKEPKPADIVVCTDVLEHIEYDCLPYVLADLHRLTKQVLFATVAMRPAKKVLPDGRNAHLIQENSIWWLKRLMEHFELTSFQIGKGEFTALMTPLTASLEVQNETTHS